MTQDVNNIDREHISMLVTDLLDRIKISTDKFKEGSNVEYSYIREQLDRLNVLVEMEIK